MSCSQIILLSTLIALFFIRKVVINYNLGIINAYLNWITFVFLLRIRSWSLIIVNALSSWSVILSSPLRCRVRSIISIKFLVESISIIEGPGSSFIIFAILGSSNSTSKMLLCSKLLSVVITLIFAISSSAPLHSSWLIAIVAFSILSTPLSAYAFFNFSAIALISFTA